MGRLEAEFADHLVVIGVHSAKFPAEQITANVRAAVERYDVHHPVVNDADFLIWQQYAVRAWPSLMFIDPTGRVWGKHEGEFPYETLRDVMAEALERYAADGLLSDHPIPVEPIPAGTTTLRYPGKVLADSGGQRLIISDSGHHRLVVTDLDGAIRQVIGTGQAGFDDGARDQATFNHPEGLALTGDGQTLFVADRANHALRQVDLRSGDVITVAGTGDRASYRTPAAAPGRETALASPWDLTLFDDSLWIAMAGTHQVWTYDLATERVRIAAGTGAESIHDGPLAEATFAQPCGITAHDGVLFTADSETSSIRRIDPGGDRVRRLVGRGLFDFGDQDGTGDYVRLQHPLGVTTGVQDDEAAVYLTDAYNHKLKRLDPATRTVTTIAGSGDSGHDDGPLTEATFREPSGLSPLDRTLYVADTNNHAIRAVDLDAGIVRTVEVSE